MSHRAPLVDALRVSFLSVAWSAVAGTASIVVGAQAHSTALIGTGADVMADLASSMFLIWRFRAEQRGHQVAAPTAERRAQVVASSALLLVAAGLIIAAVLRLRSGEGASAGAAAVTLAVVSVVVLPLISRRKYAVAARVPSPALRTDGHIGLVGTATALLTVAGLVATRTLNWSAADPIAAMIIAGVAAATGSTGLRAARRHAGH